MEFDEMIEVWRTQNDAPLYRVNPALLRVVVQQEHAQMRRESGWDLWFLPFGAWMAALAMMAVLFALVFVTVARGWIALDAWDYLAIGIASGAMLAWPAIYWTSYSNQRARERAFGNSLQDEVRRNLSRIDYHLSRYGKLTPSLLMLVPFAAVIGLFLWFMVRTDEGPFQARASFFIAALSMLIPFGSAGHYYKQRLQEQKRRLTQFLEILNREE